MENIGLFAPIETEFLDYKFQNRNRIDKADTNIVFIAIDQSSLNFFDKEQVAWPWPRIFYAKTIDFLNRSGVKAAVIDIDLSSRLKEIESDGGESDSSLISALRKCPNPFLIAISSNDSTVQNKNVLSKFSVDDSLKWEIPNYSNLILPNGKYLIDNINLGIANLLPGEDGIIRSVSPAYKVRNRYYYSLPFSVFKILDKSRKSPEVIHKNEVLINWYGKGGPEGTFKYYSIASIILSEVKLENGEMPIVNPSVMRDKIVFIGGTAPSLLDYNATPMSKLGIFPSMEIHATVLNNLLKDDFLFVIPEIVLILFNLFVILFVGYLILFYQKIYRSVAYSIALLLVLIFISEGLFLINIQLPVISTIFDVLLTLIASLIIVYVFEGREKRELKQLFSKYVSPAIVDEIIKNSNQIDLTGREITATVFFSDIEGFTSISEKLEPKELVYYLNQYFEKVSDVILDHKAMLDKYIGDGIMAIYGAPLLTEDHAIQACKTALLIQKELNTIKLDDNLPVFVTRIGLNTGKMILGNIGTSRRMDFTAIGDAVNLSSRLEGMNKVFGTNILAAESTVLLCEEEFIFREIDLIAVKGKEKPVRVYELIESKDLIAPNLIKFINYFENGLELYRERKWEKAKESFINAHKIRPSDKACSVYIQRCDDFLIKEPDENWNGVFYAATK